MIPESLLKPLESLLNRQIESSTPAREYCEQLEGKHLAIQVKHTKLVIYILVKDGLLHLSSEYDEDPDAVIILEVFRKKTQTTPKQTITVCKERLRQYDKAV